MKSVNNSTLYQDTRGSTKPSSRFGTQDSGESGDSEIEADFGTKEGPANLFEQRAAGVEMHRGEKTRSKNPFEVSVNSKREPVQHGDPALYSLLREEREAELDSDLLIESASEESPKREQVVKYTLKPSSPPSSPPPVSSTVTPPLKEREPEVKEEKKEKPHPAPREKPSTQPQEKEDQMFTKPEVKVSYEQHPLEDGGGKNMTISCDFKMDPEEVELLLFLQNFNKQKGKKEKKAKEF